MRITIDLIGETLVNKLPFILVSAEETRFCWNIDALTWDIESDPGFSEVDNKFLRIFRIQQ
jgi:hypothetical protein